MMAASSVGTAERVVLRPDGTTGRAVELFVAAPRGAGTRPAILFVHGHQIEQRAGGRDMVDNGVLVRIASQARWVAASVSQPGYGGSDGPPDYCGPTTQRATRATLAYLRQRPKVDPRRMVLYGASRGAIASAMVAAEEPSLRALVLVAGTYDLGAAYAFTLPGIREVIEKEAGATPQAFAARSALRIADRIRTATLIMHGRHDDRLPPAQAEAFAAALERHGTDVSLVICDSGHVIPFGDRWEAIRPFLSRILASAP